MRFLVGTQSLKFNSNQVHLVELNEETGNLKTQIFQHPVGEVWSIQSSPTESDKFITSYNTIIGMLENCLQILSFANFLILNICIHFFF